MLNSTSNLDTNVSKVIIVTAICVQPSRLTNTQPNNDFLQLENSKPH